MSGSVTPEFGTIIKVFVVLVVFLGLEYAAVVLRLSLHDERSLTWRITFGAITPMLVILSLIISWLADNKGINVASVVILVLVNLMYLLLPFSSYLSRLIYDGGKKELTTILVGFTSVLSSLIILAGFLAIVYWTLRLLKL